MRIENARLLNYTTLTSEVVTFPSNANALLVCGPNGAGKSSLIRAIRFALTGELPEGIQYKKDLKEILTRGETKGHVSVQLLADGRSEEYGVNLKDGSFLEATPPPINRFGLDPASFMRLEPAKRRSAVFKMAGISLSAAAIAEDLVKRGHAQTWVDKIKVGISGGLDAAQKQAEQFRSEATGAWGAVTGERYGSVKAKDWAAPKPNTVELQPINEKLAGLNNRRKAQQTLLSQMRADDRAHVDANSKRAEAAELEGRDLDVSQIERKIAASQERVAELQRTVVGPRDGWSATCPCCDSQLFSPSPGVLEEVTEAHGMNVSVAAAGLEAERGVLAELNRQIGAARNKATNARAARLFLENLPERPTPEQIREEEVNLSELDADIAVVQAELTSATDANNKAAQADVMTKKAAAYHAEISAMVKLSEELEKLPGEYIKRAMEPLNAQLSEASRVMGFQSVVSLTNDMELRYGSFSYQRSSESQQWRCELALGLALAENGIVLMDRFDCIQPLDRGAILVALGAQTRAQVFVGATLKSEPAQLPAGVAAHWLG